jgi:adenylate cyclase
MGTEIERKFLVADPAVVDGIEGTVLRQGYLSRAAERTVRVRHAGDRAFVTVKGRNTGATRSEWEWEIPVDDAEAMLAICDGPIIHKTRYLVEHDGRTWEVDVFAGANAGLVMAEIELEAEDAEVSLPSWVEREVTDDPRYYNSSLAVRPMGGAVEEPVR